jgi:hypothetical protein
LLLRYLTARLTHRDAHTRRYLRMGLGIERRARELSVFWESHQENTRRAQRRWAETVSGRILTVLGAGRLFDFESGLASRFDSLRLVDADPLCRGAWDQLDRPVEPVLTDVSSCIDQWTADLESLRLPWAETLDVIRRHSEPVPAYSQPTDALLSLNLLGQLPVGWQDGVYAYLCRRFGRSFVDSHEEEWLDAVRPGNRMLIEQHLAAVERSGPMHVLLITDLQYVQYFGRKYKRGRRENEPVSWSAGRWESSNGVRCEITPALEDIDLEAGAFARWMPSYQLEWSESWLWHISPMAVECRHCGTIHRVGAFALKRLDPAR